MSTNPIAGEIWYHHKGGAYSILMLANLESSKLSTTVVYAAIGDPGVPYARAFDNFMSRFSRTPPPTAVSSFDSLKTKVSNLHRHIENEDPSRYIYLVNSKHETDMLKLSDLDHYEPHYKNVAIVFNKHVPQSVMIVKIAYATHQIGAATVITSDPNEVNYIEHARKQNIRAFTPQDINDHDPVSEGLCTNAVSASAYAQFDKHTSVVDDAQDKKPDTVTVYDLQGYAGYHKKPEGS